MIRPALSEDLPACSRLIARIPFFAAYFDEVRALTLLQGRPAHHALLVAEHDSTIVGLSWFVERDQLSRGGYLKLFAVAPEVQGKGVAAELLHASETQVFAHSAVFFLMVNTQNEQAQHFYARHGYQEMGVIPDYAVPGQDELLMFKRQTN